MSDLLAVIIHKLYFSVIREVVMKYLILFVVIALVWSFWKKQNRPAPKNMANPEDAAQKMLVCVHCGVHFPESDGVDDAGKAYCSEAHRQAADQAGR